MDDEVQDIGVLCQELEDLDREVRGEEVLPTRPTVWPEDYVPLTGRLPQLDKTERAGLQNAIKKYDRAGTGELNIEAFESLARDCASAEKPPPKTRKVVIQYNGRALPLEVPNTNQLEALAQAIATQLPDGEDYTISCQGPLGESQTISDDKAVEQMLNSFEGDPDLRLSKMNDVEVKEVFHMMDIDGKGSVDAHDLEYWYMLALKYYHLLDDGCPQVRVHATRKPNLLLDESIHKFPGTPEASDDEREEVEAEPEPDVGMEYLDPNQIITETLPEPLQEVHRAPPMPQEMEAAFKEDIDTLKRRNLKIHDKKERGYVFLVFKKYYEYVSKVFKTYCAFGGDSGRLRKLYFQIFCQECDMVDQHFSSQKVWSFFELCTAEVVIDRRTDGEDVLESGKMGLSGIWEVQETGDIWALRQQGTAGDISGYIGEEKAANITGRLKTDTTLILAVQWNTIGFREGTTTNAKGRVSSNGQRISLSVILDGKENRWTLQRTQGRLRKVKGSKDIHASRPQFLEALLRIALHKYYPKQCDHAYQAFEKLISQEIMPNALKGCDVDMKTPYVQKCFTGNIKAFKLMYKKYSAADNQKRGGSSGLLNYDEWHQFVQDLLIVGNAMDRQSYRPSRRKLEVAFFASQQMLFDTEAENVGEKDPSNVNSLTVKEFKEAITRLATGLFMDKANVTRTPRRGAKGPMVSPEDALNRVLSWLNELAKQQKKPKVQKRQRKHYNATT